MVVAQPANNRGGVGDAIGPDVRSETVDTGACDDSSNTDTVSFAHISNGSNHFPSLLGIGSVPLLS